MSGPLPAHSIRESIGHDDRGTTVVTAGGLGWDYGDEAIMPLAATIASLQAILADIPPEHRETATLSFKAYGDYASLSGGDVTYLRPETDAELADRRRWLDSLKSDDEDRDRMSYTRLKAKYEGV